MDTLIQDIRYAFRSLFRQPGFALTAIVTLALGIGATTAIFSVVNAVILRPLPFERPHEMVAVQTFWSERGITSQNVSGPDFHDWKAQSQSFSSLAYYTGGEDSVTVAGVADYANLYRVTPEFMEVLGARAAAGRLLSQEEQAPGGPLAVVITDAFWRRQFNGAPSAIGATMKFEDRVFTIAGVLPPGVRYPARADVYYPAWVIPENTNRTAHNYRVVGRLREGVSVEQARAEMAGIGDRLSAAYPNSNKGKQVAVTPLQTLLVGDSTRQTLFVLLGAVGLVLLIACANVANLLLARASVRGREMVVRAAVGAGRARLVRQLLTESAVLGVIAGLCGAWMARLGVVALMAASDNAIPRSGEVRVDTTALLFAVAVALGASVLFGLAPALHISRVSLVDGLRQGGKGSSVGARTGWARSAFVVAEIALAVVLVVGAGLLSRSLAALAAVDLGFDTDRLLVLNTTVPVQTIKEAPRATAFYRDLLRDVEGVPGVDAVAAVTSLPTAVRSNGGYWIEGGVTIDQTGVRAPQALFTVATPGYFRTLRVPLKSGRDFSERDRLDAPFVAIINESLARASFPGEDPIGRRIQCGLDTLEFMTIVGVVGDVRTNGPTAPAQPEIYMPYEQHPGPATALNIVARTHSENPLVLAETIRRKIAALNPDVPVRAGTMTSTLETASATPRFRTFLLVLFAGVALLLALAGVYGVMSYTVSQRIPELGVRIALGATPRSIMSLIVSQGAVLAVTGLALGMALAMLAGRLLDGLLFGVTPRDPMILVAVTVVIAAATGLACYIPGRRAVRVDPVSAMRAD